MKLIIIVLVILLLVQPRDCQILHDLLRNILSKSASTSAASSAASSRGSYQGSVDASKPRPPAKPTTTTTTEHPFSFLFKGFSKVPANKPFNVAPPPPPPFQQKGPTRVSLPVAQPQPPLSANCGGTLAIPFFPCGNIPPPQDTSTTTAPATTTQPPAPPQPAGPPPPPYGIPPYGQYPNLFVGIYPGQQPQFRQYPIQPQQNPPPPPPPAIPADPPAPTNPEQPVPPKPENCDGDGPPFYCKDYLPQKDNSLYEPQGYQLALYQNFGGRGYDLPSNQGFTYVRRSLPNNKYSHSGYSYLNYH